MYNCLFRIAQLSPGKNSKFISAALYYDRQSWGEIGVRVHFYPVANVKSRASERDHQVQFWSPYISKTDTYVLLLLLLLLSLIMSSSIFSSNNITAPRRKEEKERKRKKKNSGSVFVHPFILSPRGEKGEETHLSSPPFPPELLILLFPISLHPHSILPGQISSREEERRINGLHLSFPDEEDSPPRYTCPPEEKEIEFVYSGSVPPIRYVSPYLFPLPTEGK